MDADLIEQYVAELPAAEASVSVYDYADGTTLSIGGGVVYHAASTMKVAVLAALAEAVQEGRFTLSDRLHVRNRFLSVADGRPYQIAASRDANAAVHAARGKTMRIRDLARHMITTSSNLATNLLIELVGVEYVGDVLERADVTGVHVRRGVEDHAAFEQGINNEVTADGLVQLFRAIVDEKFGDRDLTTEMLDVLSEQEFNSGIPAGIPEEVRQQARIAHKTGEISTVAHDAGILFIPQRDPIVLAVCTRWEQGNGGRMDVVAGVTERVWQCLSREKDD